MTVLSSNLKTKVSSTRSSVKVVNTSSGITSIEQFAESPDTVSLTISEAFPGETAVTSPESLTFAIFGSEIDQVIIGLSVVSVGFKVTISFSCSSTCCSITRYI